MGPWPQDQSALQILNSDYSSGPPTCQCNISTCIFLKEKEGTVCTSAPASYLLCYDYQVSSTSESYVANHIQCLWACVMLGDACFCKQNFNWKINDEYDELSLTCAHITCESNIVVRNAYSSAESCPDSAKSKVFNITTWFENDHLDNFLWVTPNQNIEIFVELTFEALFVSSPTTSLEVDFGDGKQEQHTSVTFKHTYVIPGSYKAKVVIRSSMFYNFTVETQIKASYSLKEAVVEECSSAYVVLSEPPEPDFNCTGFVLGGHGVSIAIDFQENVPEELNITSTNVAAVSIPSCFYGCTDFMKKPWLWEPASNMMSGTYLLPSGVFAYDGMAIGLELFATSAGTVVFQIFQPEINSYRLVGQGTYNIVAGYNVIEFEQRIPHTQNDVIGLYLEKNSRNAVQVVDTSSATKIYFYDRQFPSQTLPSKESAEVIFSGITFLLRVVAASYSYFFMEYSFSLTGPHNITFNTQDNCGVTLLSNHFEVIVASDRPEINVIPYLIRAMGEVFEICADIKHGAYFNVAWETNNSSIMQVLNGVEKNFQKYIHMPVVNMAGLQVVDCVNFRVTQIGVYTVKISASIDNKIQVSSSVDMKILQPITGVELNLVTPKPVYQTQVIIISGSIDPYPEQLSFLYYFGDGTTRSVLENELTQAHTFFHHGNYTITLNVSSQYISKTVSLSIGVENAFYINVSSNVSAGASVLFEIINKAATGKPSWMYLWAFPETVATYVNCVTQVFNLGGHRNVTCNIDTGVGIISRMVSILVLEPVSAPTISLVSDTFVNTTVILQANAVTGNFLEYMWNTGDLNVINDLGDRIIVRGLLPKSYLVSVKMSNSLHSNFAAINITLTSAYISSFSVLPSEIFVKSSSNVTFYLSSHGSLNKSYEYLFTDDYSSLVTTETVLSRQFETPGKFQVRVRLRIHGSYEKCLNSSIVPCQLILNITVNNEINELHIEHVRDNGTVEVVSDVVEILKQTDLTLKLYVIYAIFDVQLSLSVNGIALRKIESWDNGASTLTTVVISKVNFMSPGIHKCVFTASNHISNKTHMFNVIALSAVESVTIVANDAAEILSVVNFAAQVKGGSNLEFEWFETSKPNSILSTSSILAQEFVTAGHASLTVRVSNALSQKTADKVIQLILPISGEHVICPHNTIKAGTFTSIEYGVFEGNLMNFMFSIEGGLNVTLITEVDGPFESVHEFKLNDPGYWEAAVIVYNAASSMKVMKCLLSVEDVFSSVTLEITPSSFAYIGDVVQFAIAHYGGTNAKGFFEISTLYNFTVADFGLNFSPCKIPSCGHALVKYSFDKGNKYHFSGFLYNNVSQINITSHYYLVSSKRRPSGTQNYLEMVTEAALFGTPTKIYVVKLNDVDLIQCKINFGEDDQKVPLPLSSLSQVKHTYSSFGEFVMTMECSSKKGMLHLETIAHVQQNLKVKSLDSPSACILYGTSFDIKMSFEEGGMVKHVTFVVYLNNTAVEPNVTDNQGVIILTFNSTLYQYSGTTQIVINAFNHVSKRVIEVSVCIAKAVEALKGIVPVIFTYGRETPFQVSLLSETEASIYITFGDGQSVSFSTTSSNAIIKHQYMSTGHFSYVITATNEVSSKTFEGTIEVRQAVTGLSLNHTKFLQWPLNVLLLSLRDPNNYAANTGLEYSIHFGDGNVTDFFPLSTNEGQLIPLMSHAYKLPGCYAITVSVRGKLNTAVLKSDFALLKLANMKLKIKSTYGAHSLPNLLNTDYPFYLNVMNGAVGCYDYRWLMKKNGNEIVHSSVSTEPLLFVDSLVNQVGSYQVSVTIALSDLSFAVGAEVIQLQTGIPEMFLIPAIKKNSSLDQEFLIVVQIHPEVINEFIIDFGDHFSVIMQPQFSTNKDLLENTGYTFEGSVNIHEVSHSYKEKGTYVVTLSAANQVSVFNTSKTILISEIFCERPKVKILSAPDNTVKFHYLQHISILSHVHHVNCGRSKRIGFLWKLYESNDWDRKQGVSSVGKPEISLDAATTRSSLNIDKRVLVAGVYIVRLTAILVDYSLDDTDEIYLVIVEDKLNAVISGGSLKQLPWNQDFTLDASLSNDPNEVNQDTLEYEWFCEMELPEETIDCFGSGPNKTEFFGAKWFFKKRVLLEGVLYKFKVVVSNYLKRRSAETMQSVLLVDAVIPIVNIKCASNCKKFINPSDRFSLTGSCENCESSNVDFVWTQISNGSGIIFKTDALTEQSSPNLVLKANVLMAGETYRLALTARKRSGVSARSEYHFSTRSLPSGGSCNISQTTGIALQTTFTISCKNWVSSAGALKYRVSQKTIEEAGQLSYELLAFGPVETLSVLLKSGLESDDYNVTVVVEVLDLYLSSTTVSFAVKVKPYIEETNRIAVQNELLNLTMGEDSKLEELAGTGDTQGLLQLIGSIAGTLNEADKIDRTMEVDGNGETELHESMEVRKQIRNAMVKTLTQVDAESPDSIKQKSETIAPLLEVPDEVSVETQELALKSFNDMTSFLETDADILESDNPDKIVDVTNGLVKATGNLLQAILLGPEKNETNSEMEIIEQGSKKENFSRNALGIVDKVMPLLLLGKVAGEAATRISSSTIALELSRQTAQDFSRADIRTLDGGSFVLPSNMFDFENETVIIDSKMSTLPTNPFSWHESSQHINAPISSLSFSTASNGSEIPVNNLKDGHKVELYVPQSSPVSKLQVNLSSLFTDRLTVYKVTIRNMNSSLVAILNASDVTPVEVFFRRRRHPTVSVYDKRFVVNHTMDTYMLFDTWASTSFYYIGLRLLNHGRDKLNNDSCVLEMSLSSTGCMFWNEEFEIWKTNGCQVGPQTTFQQTHCVCDHLTWFGSNFFIPPNELDVEEEILKLKDIDEYPALLATFCVICAVYVLVMVWARRADMKEAVLKQGEPTFLRSQSGLSGKTYHLTVYTGHRGGSGTTATPALILSGQSEDSPTLVLVNRKRKLFERGSVETFVFTLDVDVGDIKYVTIWHDDTGDDPGWFLSRLIITDISENKQHICFCNDWLAVDQSDSLINRSLPVASEKELRSFENIFLATTARDLNDGHLWFSILSRPPRSHFTRMQRVSCCLCLLLCTMLANAMFYRVTEGRAVGDEIDMSGIKISWTNILIGFQSSLIVLPINIFTVLLFRRAQPSDAHDLQKKKEQRKTKKNTCLAMVGGRRDRTLSQALYEHDALEMGTPGKKESNATEDPFSGSEAFTSFYTANTTCETLVHDVSDVDVQFSQFSVKLPDEVTYWPFWLKYVAWCLVAATSFVSGFFTLLYGLSFGRKGQEEWLFSFFVSVFTDFVFNQPVKVIVLAALVTLIFRNLKDEYIQAEIENFRAADITPSEEDPVETEFIHNIHRPAPPSKSYIMKTRKKRLYEAKMVDIVVEITVYMFYLLLCLMITYGHRDPEAYDMTKSIENLFITGKFDQIQTIPDFWSWTSETLTSGLFDDETYTGKKIHHPGYLNGGATLLVGSVRMRQVRVKQERCIAYSRFGLNISNCGMSFSNDHEEKKRQFCTSWLPCGFGETPLHPTVWRYQDSHQTGSYETSGRVNAYSGGGYIVEFSRTKKDMGAMLTYLFKHSWLDDMTRAVFIEFTAYNSQVNFYIMIMMLLEVPASGGAFTFKRILSTRLDRYSSGFSILLGACEFLFIGITVYYMYREARKLNLLRWKYLADWRNWVELLGFVMIWSAFALLMVRFRLVGDVKEKYSEDPRKFVNFETAALGDQVYGYVLAFVAVLVVVKFLKLLRFNRKMSLMTKTVMYASQDLKYFVITFSLIFLTYSLFTHLLFVTSIEDYSTFPRTLVSLLNMVLGSYVFSEFVSAHDVLGHVFFITFVFIMTYVTLNMFISIINEAFATVDDALKDRKNKYELVDFLVQRLAGFLPASMTKKKVRFNSLAPVVGKDNSEDDREVTERPISYLLPLIRKKLRFNRRKANEQIPTTSEYVKIKSSFENESESLTEKKSIEASAENIGENSKVRLKCEATAINYDRTSTGETSKKNKAETTNQSMPKSKNQSSNGKLTSGEVSHHKVEREKNAKMKNANAEKNNAKRKAVVERTMKRLRKETYTQEEKAAFDQLDENVEHAIEEEEFYNTIMSLILKVHARFNDE